MQIRRKFYLIISLGFLVICVGSLSGCLSDSGSSTNTTATTSSTSSSGASIYPGFTSATAVSGSTSSIALTFPSVFSVSSTFTGLNIYASARGGTYNLVASVGASVTTYTVTGLLSGTTYTFRGNPVISGVEVAVFTTISAQTTSLTSTNYQGGVLVQAYGPAPNAPVAPTTAQVNITWRGFLNSSVSKTYALVRTVSGNVLDSTTTTACTASLTTSCLVCNATGLGTHTCSDSNVALSPQTYDYTVVQWATTNWPEETPSSGDNSYRIKVPIPPSNMVLVHRDAANYEQCSLLGKTSDPLNHQRCPYTGLGAVPYNSNPGNSALALTAGYYDFGYNLFVDRWVAACNWTPSLAGGFCGAAAAAGDCYGSGAAPANTIGIAGNVYYATDTGACYYKPTTGAAWITTNATTFTSSQYAAMYTIDPGSAGYNHKPPFSYIDQNDAYSVCNSIVDSSYGAKRLPRNREYVAMSAWLSAPGDPNALTDAQITTLEQFSSNASPHYGCNTSYHNGITAGAFTTTDLAGDAGNAVQSFDIGSIETSNCVSRFGIQDPIGNINQFASDQISCSTSTHTCTGIHSDLDSGNGYGSGFDLNGFNFDGVQGPGGTSGGQTNPNYTFGWGVASGVVGGSGSAQGYGAGYFNTTLGLPLVGTDGGNSQLISSFSPKLPTTYDFLGSDYVAPGARSLAYGGESYHGGSRWAQSWGQAPTGGGLGSSLGFRCALPAE